MTRRGGILANARKMSGKDEWRLVFVGQALTWNQREEVRKEEKKLEDATKRTEELIAEGGEGKYIVVGQRRRWPMGEVDEGDSRRISDEEIGDDAGIHRKRSDDARMNEASLTLLYTNAQSLVNKVNEMKAVTAINNPDLIIVTETWTNDSRRRNDR